MFPAGRTSLVLFSLTLSLSLCGPVVASHDRAQKEVLELSRERLEATVREAKIFSSEYPAHVLVHAPEVEVFTVRHPKATDQDCKIDAVLLAKLLFDKYPKLTRLKLVFHDDKSALSQSVMVTTGDVRAYGSGSINQDELLSSLELTAPSDSEREHANGEGASDKLEGPFARGRQLLLDRIGNIRNNGTDTKPFETLFGNLNKEAESLAGQGKISPQDMAHLKDEITDLNRHLSDQEEMIREAKNISHGYGQNRSGKLWNSFNGGTDGAYLNLKRSGAKFQLFKSVKNAIEQKQAQGINASVYQQKFDQIRRLRLSGKIDQADQAMQELARSLGISSEVKH